MLPEATVAGCRLIDRRARVLGCAEWSEFVEMPHGLRRPRHLVFDHALVHRVEQE
jgi:hypothetical protein